MIILVGPSASGKTEVAKYLGRKYQIEKVITHTTRPKRSNEVDGVDYYFVSDDDFNHLKKADAFVETTKYSGLQYGTAKKDLGENKVLIVDPNGLKAFQALNDQTIVTFFLASPQKIRYQRMLSRGDRFTDAQKRIKNDAISFAPDKIQSIDYTIDSELASIEHITDQIYQLYHDHLSKLNRS